MEQIVYPLGTPIGDMQYRDLARAKRQALLIERGRQILNGEDIPMLELPPRSLGLISDFGYHPRPETSDTRGLDYSEGAERQARKREHSNRRRARTAGANIVGTIDRQAIIARDKGICHICKAHVEATDIHLDHVIPLAQGGDHSADNLRVSHSTCNLSKGSRLVA